MLLRTDENLDVIRFRCTNGGFGAATPKGCSLVSAVPDMLDRIRIWSRASMNAVLTLGRGFCRVSQEAQAFCAGGRAARETLGSNAATMATTSRSKEWEQ